MREQNAKQSTQRTASPVVESHIGFSTQIETIQDDFLFHPFPFFFYRKHKL